MCSRLVVPFALFLMGLSFASTSAAEGVVPGYFVHHFVGGITKPYRLAFSPAGQMFVGTNVNTGSEWALRVPPAGGTFTNYGAVPYDDPDALAFDLTGAISGTPGALLVGRAHTAGAAQLSAVLPNQSIVDLEGPSALLGNPDAMVFDHSGRLLITDFFQGNVLVKNGTSPATTLFTIPSIPVAIAVDAADRIFTSAQDGKVRVHSSAGALLNDAFLTGLPETPLAFGPGTEYWGADLYCVDNVAGELLRVAPDGSRTTIGT